MDAGRPYRTAFVFDHPEDLVPVLSRLFQPLALFLERGRESSAEPRGDFHVLEPRDHHLGLLDAGRSQLELAAPDDWAVHDACTNPSRWMWCSLRTPGERRSSPLSRFYKTR